MPSLSADRFLPSLLVVYLFVIALIATVNLVVSFDVGKSGEHGVASEASASSPTAQTGSRPCSAWLLICKVQGDDARLLTQAFLAGIVGSFLHAAQSLTSYVGNGTFKSSWAAWYVLRPWIGGILGLAMAFVARAGLIGGGNPNVNGLVALGVLGGWFSKTTTDKLQEVFSTLFKTDADSERKDKLQGDQPSVTSVNPSPVPVAAANITVVGTGFITDAKVTINAIAVQTTFVSETQLDVDLAGLMPRPVGAVPLVVTNPFGANRTSDQFEVTFE